MKLYIFDIIDSTIKKARDHLNEHCAILAFEQEAGMGKQGSIWHSPKGNLYLSLVLDKYTFCKLEELALIFATSVFLTIELFLPQQYINQLKYKYPNDIYLYNKKISGVLVEVHGNKIIASMGVNLQTAPDPFISLKEICQHDIDPVSFYNKLYEIHETTVLKNILTQGMDYILTHWNNRLLKPSY